MNTEIGSGRWISPDSNKDFIEGIVIQILPDGDHVVALGDGRVFIRSSFSSYFDRPRVW